MKRSFLALALLALLASAACAPKSKQAPVAHPIHGLWAWEVSDKGFFGFSRGNPDGAWITSTIRFAPDGRYEQFQDAKLIVSGGTPSGARTPSSARKKWCTSPPKRGSTGAAW
ncbi:MAG: hypothetical protein IPH48_15945 [bacterium]|nr:hypothetical protein [bacterium]